eukprot:COSAG06_NODE_59275_length_274_cov_1.651429_1_plen_38_part_10
MFKAAFVTVNDKHNSQGAGGGGVVVQFAHQHRTAMDYS